MKKFPGHLAAFARHAGLVTVLLAGAAMPVLGGGTAEPSLYPAAVGPVPETQPPSLTRAGEPPIEPGDVLSVRVVTYNLLKDELRDWPGATGEVTVQGDGTIMVPFAGTVPAAGRSPDDIVQDIVRGLRASTGVQSPPAVTIEIAERRPVYVSGDVMSPGAVAFQAGITVRQALALAGGPLRIPPQSDAALLGRQVQIREGLLRAELRIARLEAELAGADHFDVPDSIGERPELASLVAVEQELMQARRTSLAAQTASVDDLVSVLTRVKSGLEEQVGLIQADVQRAEENLARKQDLLDRGLTPAADVSNAETSLSNQMMRVADINTQLLNVEQDLSEARRSRDDLVQTRGVDILEELGSMRDHQRDLELEGAYLAPGFDLAPGSQPLGVLLIDGATGTSTLVGPETPLWPSDTLVVSTGIE